jgi:23S rRNA (cytidine1920-2'-O)/16S rRNA (cytidine1409-2'-O)-methyltransferase
MIALVKPQFEIDPDTSGFDGVVRDPALLRQTVEDVAGRLIGEGIDIRGATASPIHGRRGNTEFLFLISAPWGSPLHFLPEALSGAQVGSACLD